jgi:hypothetical protein
MIAIFNYCSDGQTGTADKIPGGIVSADAHKLVRASRVD